MPYGRLRHLGLAALVLFALAPAAAAAAAGEAPFRFQRGDVLVARGDGKVSVYREGRESKVLTAHFTDRLKGMARDSRGNVLVTAFDAGAIARFDARGRRLDDLGSDYFGPESIGIDGKGHIYVGQAGNEGSPPSDTPIVRLDPGGEPHQYVVEVGPRGTDWIDLDSDQCTLLYTSEGKRVRRYDVCRRRQLSKLADGLPGTRAFALRITPSGDVLVADTELIVRLGAHGDVVAEYDDGAQDYWFAVNLDPDGHSFWSADGQTGRVTRFDIATGRVLQRFDAGADAEIGGLLVIGEVTAARATGVPALAHSLRTPSDVSWAPGRIVTNLALTAALLFLIAFPAQLFNSTFETHYDELRVALARMRPKIPRAPASGRAARWAVYAGVVVATAFLYALLDPGFPSRGGAAELYVGMLLGLLVTTLVFAAASVGYARLRSRQRARLRVFAGSLPIALLCVAISRLVHFQPGYLYGVIANAEHRGETSTREEGRRTAVAAAWLFALGVAAWLARTPVHERALADGSAFVTRTADVGLVVIFTAAVEALAFGLVPLRFLDGAKVFAWSRVAWAALFAASVFLLLQVLLNPQSGYVSTSPFVTTLLLFGCFGAASALFWGYFRFRRVARAPQRPVPHA